jgi:heptosyltransferase III
MPSQPPSRSAHAPAPRVLVIRRRYLGDVVLLGSLFRNIRLQWPEAHIAVLTEPAYIGALTLNPDVNAAIPLPASHQVAALTALAWRLWQSRFTHVIDVDNTDKTALLAFSSGAPIRVTYNRETGGTHFRWAYSRYADLGDAFYATHHITETYLVLLEPMGIEVRTRDVRLVPRLEDLAAIGPLLPAATAGQRRVLVHPGSRSPYRIWPVERFASVCDRIQRELGATVLVVAGPGEQELGRQIRAQMETPVAVIERALSLGEFAALASRCDLFLCHDSGPMHVAAAVGTSVVALLSSQNAAIWRPFGDGHTVLQTPLPCACIGTEAPTPCDRNNGYRSYCVRMIQPDEAFAAVAKALGQKAPTQ